MFAWTRLGRDIIAIGSDRSAAITAGVGVDGLIVGIFAFSGLCAALSGVLKGAPWAITVAEAIEGPEKVGTGVGVAAVPAHCPFTTTPSLGILDTFAIAITLAELVATTYSVSLAGS